MSVSNNHSNTIWQFLCNAAAARRQDILAAITSQYGWTVADGPFAGMVLSDITSWGEGHLLPKLIGCYESELHPILAEIIQNPPDLVVNIGAAEGYYAVGMARLLPNAFVHAFDTATEAQNACRHAAALNGVSDRVSVAGQCTPEVLQAILPRSRSPIVICDCEGGEYELIDPARVPALRASTIIVECHDFMDGAITPTLQQRLSPTHTLIAIREGPRDPNASPLLRKLNSLDRWLVVCEDRPSMMHWLLARPR